MTECLSTVFVITGIYDCAYEMLRNVTTKTRENNILDLCSGAGGPWPRLISLFSKDDVEISVTLSDKFPTTKNNTKNSSTKITVSSIPIDALEIPLDSPKVITMFTGLHHFSPAEVKRIFKSVEEQKKGFCAFEVTELSFTCILAIFLMPLFLFVATPFIKPFSFKRLFFTYILPIIPFAVWYDGIISSFNSYKLCDLKKLVLTNSNASYNWEVGRKRSKWSLLYVTYIIGMPNY
jgi:hypothetical protein